MAFLHPGLVHSPFMESLINLLMYDTAVNQRIVNGGGYLGFEAGANLAGPRNEVVKKFLNYQAEWLWFVDSDMTFAPDTVEKLLEQADPEKAPIVGGLCFGFDENGEVQPTLFGLDGEEDNPYDVKVIRYHEWPPDSMYQVAATGGACLLIHRSVFERMLEVERPDGGKGFDDAFPWFQEVTHGGKPVGEDITFCWRAGLAGIPVWVNTAVQLGHVKRRILTMQSYFLSRGLLSPQHLVGSQ